jgi:hypothetical protein
MKYRIALLISALAATTIVLGASPALAASNSDPELLTEKTAAVMAGDTAWVALNWLGEGGDVTDFGVVARSIPKGWRVEYPENTVDHTSLYWDADLAKGEIDFTALRISVPASERDRDGTIHLRAHWTERDGKERHKEYKIEVPVARHSGADFEVLTDSVSVASGEAAWVDVTYTGSYPELGDFTLTVSEAPGLTIVYPGYGDHTSLNADTTLDRGETDVARFMIDATAAEPGTVELEVTVRYTKGGDPESMTHVVVVEITGGATG